MVAHIKTATIVGIEGYLIDVEVDTNLSLPSIVIVGLPDTAVSEAKERIRAAIKNCSYSFPSQKVIINLAPADIKKEGSCFDLPMAIGILGCSGVVDLALVSEYACGFYRRICILWNVLQLNYSAYFCLDDILLYECIYKTLRYQLAIKGNILCQK